MAQPNNYVTFRVTEQEKEILAKYCEQEQRTQSDVLRNFVRSLKRKLDGK
ncbi:CopG family transcriptional regulator [Scytonema tolypothrichoides VB-61278]|nr:CopG family transcriptional regulator [Scytonema tolypothrichoides VB-61278]